MLDNNRRQSRWLEIVAGGRPGVSEYQTWGSGLTAIMRGGSIRHYGAPNRTKALGDEGDLQVPRRGYVDPTTRAMRQL